MSRKIKYNEVGRSRRELRTLVRSNFTRRQNQLR